MSCEKSAILTMAHTLDIHIKNINSLCRICGESTQTQKHKKDYKYPVPVEKFSKQLLFICGNTLEEGDFFSKYICQKCVRRTQNCVQSQSQHTKERIISEMQASKHLWVNFETNMSVHDCPPCTQINNLKQGAVKHKTKSKKKSDKKKKVLNPIDSDANNTHVHTDTSDVNSIDTNTVHISQHATNHDDIHTQNSSQAIDQGSMTSETVVVTPHSSVTQSLTATTCQSTSAPPDSPTHSDTDDFLSMAYTEMQADIDNEFDNNVSQIKQNTVSTPIKNIIPDLNVHCLDKISPIRKSVFTSPKDKYFQTLQNALDKSLSEPLDQTEKLCATKFVKRIMTDNSKNKLDPNVIKLKTAGQPLTFTRTIVSRKQSVGKSCSRERVRMINKYRKESGCNIEKEFSLITKSRRDRIIRNTKGWKKVHLDRKRALALKETLGLSSRKARLMHETLRDLGVCVEGEKKQIALAKEIIQKFVNVKEKAFRTGCLSEVTSVPFVKINDLPKFLDQHLNYLHEKQLLTWRDGIDDDTIIVKIGADHGKSSLKFTLEVANTFSPNSQQNTIVIAMASVKDSYENLKDFLEEGILDDIKRLQNYEWKGKKIKIILNGDYEFLCKAYGISGAAGKYPCIWCLVPSDDLDKTDKIYQARSNQSIMADHNRFQKEADGDKDFVKFYNNALHPPLLPIELYDVSPPYLHVLLGNVWRHHVLLKKEIFKIEIMLIEQDKKTCTKKGLELKEYGNNFDTKTNLEEQMRVIETFLNCCQSGEVQSTYENLQNKTESELAGLLFEKLEKNKGPISKSVDKLLTKHRITSQSYHGGAFTGNHCHKYVSNKVYSHLTSHLTEQAQLYTTNKEIIDKAHDIKKKFDDINEKFYKVHKAVSHTRKIQPHEIDNIQTDIDIYIKSFLEHFSSKLIPKQHILHRHITPFIRRHTFACGLMG